MIVKLLATLFLASVFSDAFGESCYPMNAPRMAFSPYLPTGLQPDDIETIIDFYCSPAFQGNKLHVSVSLQSSSQIPIYQLRNESGDVIRYGLFIDSARSIPLTSDMTIPLVDVNPSAKTFSVVLYGRIFPNQRTAGIGHYRGFLNLQLSY